MTDAGSRLFSLVSLLVLLQGCLGLQTPRVTDPARRLASFTHTGSEKSCAICHEGSRPGAATSDTRSSSTNHFSPRDCGSCHSVSNAAARPFLFQHKDSTEATVKTCLPCHEADRKSGTHYPGQDCSSCHLDPGKTWLTSSSSPHPQNLPMPASCNGCHEGSRPAQTQYPAPGSLVSGHFSAQDCIQCHAPKSEIVPKFAFTHGANDRPLSSCLPCHEARRPTVLVRGYSHAAAGAGDCVGCHKQPGVTWADGAFDHLPAPTSCNACHEAQRPTVLTGSFSHNTHGTGDCVTCHKANIGISWAGGTIDHAPFTVTTACASCHLSGSTFLSVGSSATNSLTAATTAIPAGTITAGHKMIHSPISFVANDCDDCHSVSSSWGFSWKTATVSPMGGTNHARIPTTTTCKTCHTYPTGSFSVAGSSPSSPFRHSGQGDHSRYDCSRCHTAAAYTWKLSTPSSNCKLCH